MRLHIPSSPTSRTYAAAIFDFEGTLVDFQWQLKPAEDELRRAFAGLGFDREAFANGNYATMWNAAADLLAREGRMAELRQALCPIYDRWDLDALSRWAPRPGAAELLCRLVAGGSRVGMVSNVGRDALTYMKPRPEGILRVLAEWRVAPGDVLFVGDSRADVFGARAAGMPVAIIRGGECDETAFADVPPDHMISQLNELVGTIAGT